jgi:hypothetical protein
MCAGATASCRGQVRAQVTQTTGRGYQADPTTTRATTACAEAERWTACQATTTTDRAVTAPVV